MIEYDLSALRLAPKEGCDKAYLKVLKDKDLQLQRYLCQYDLYYLLTVGMNRKDIMEDTPLKNTRWLYDRIRQVEAKPNGMLDLWAREHYKSTVITYAKTIQDILVNPSITVGIFSHTRKIALAFVRQIKAELESNEYLKALFPEILFEKPSSQAPSWSVEGGLIVRRPSNPKECTVEGWGVVDSQPTGKHFELMIYDDLVTLESVSTPDQLEKTMSAWEMSLSLGAEGGSRRIIGTRYHTNDAYGTMIRRGSVDVRLHPATIDGTPSGKSVFLSDETLAKKYRDYGPNTFASQMLQNPLADGQKTFLKEDVMYYTPNPRLTSGMNIAIITDPATTKKKSSDYTVMLVMGKGADGNTYLLDGFRDRLSLNERAKRLIALHRKWRPLRVGYEQYGAQCDIEHVLHVQNEENYRFSITALGGNMLSKEDRIRKLQPIVANHRLYIPRMLYYSTSEGTVRDLVQEFLEELDTHPLSTHDDILDTAARTEDTSLGLQAPYVASEYVGVVGKPLTRDPIDIIMGR